MAEDTHVKRTPEGEKQRKSRNLAIGLSLAAFVILIFVITVARLGPGVLDRPM